MEFGWFQKKGKHRLGGDRQRRTRRWCCGRLSSLPGHEPTCTFMLNQTLIGFTNSNGEIITRIDGLGNVKKVGSDAS